MLLGWSQIELAKRSRVAIGTIRRLEAFPKEVVAYTSTLDKVQAAMEKAGIEFLNHTGPGVKLRLAQGREARTGGAQMKRRSSDAST